MARPPGMMTREEVDAAAAQARIDEAIKRAAAARAKADDLDVQAIIGSRPPPELSDAAPRTKAKPRPATFEPTGECAAELMHRTFAPLRWLVEDLVPEGTILVAGKPKSGKSWLVLDIMVSARLQIGFLNRSVTPCDGLYLALEDNPRRMRSRLETLMRHYHDRIEDLRGFEFRTEWPAGAAGAEALDRYLTEHPNCRLVAVDVLKRIRPIADARRSAYETDYEAIAPWKAVADKHRITLILVHHTRKAEADDVFDEVSGTLGINGAVDQMLILRRLPSDPKMATLHARGRDLPEDHELGIELRDGWWEFVGHAQAIEASEAQKAVLLALNSTDTPMTATEVMKAIGKKGLSGVTKLLTRMVRAGLVQVEGKRYRIPDNPRSL